MNYTNDFGSTGIEARGYCPRAYIGISDELMIQWLQSVCVLIAYAG